MATAHSRVRRTLRAQVRDARVLLTESRGPLLLFAAILILSSLALQVFYVNPETGARPDPGEALFAALGLVFFQTTFPFPDQWGLRLLYFIIPIVGLVAAGDAVLRFGAALIDKQSRGQKWQAAMASTYKDHVIICGLGKVGYRVALELLKMGRDVVGIELNGDGRFVQEALAQGIPVLVADARRPEALERAGIRHAHVIIPATENELTNLDIALDARELNPDVRVVMRMFDPDLARRVEKGFGLNTAYSVSALAAPVFAAAAMRTDVKASFYAGDTLLNVIEVLLGPMSGVTGRTVASLESEFDVSVVARFGPDGVDLRPAADVVLTPGDRLYVLGPLDRLSHVNRANDGATAR